MSVHNGAKFLNRAVESILNQSIQDFEFIICDDASTDDTYEKLVEYKNQDSRFTIIQNEKNQQMFGEGNR